MLSRVASMVNGGTASNSGFTASAVMASAITPYGVREVAER